MHLRRAALALIVLALIVASASSAHARRRSRAKAKKPAPLPELVVEPRTEHTAVKLPREVLPSWLVDSGTAFELRVDGPGTLRLHIRPVFTRQESGEAIAFQILRDGRPVADLSAAPGGRKARVPVKGVRGRVAGPVETFEAEVPEGTHNYRVVPKLPSQVLAVRAGLRPKPPPAPVLAEGGAGTGEVMASAAPPPNAPGLIPLAPVKKEPEPEAPPPSLPPDQIAAADFHPALPERHEDPNLAPIAPGEAFHVTPRVGVMLPLDGFGTLTPTGAMEVRYAPPVLSRQLSFGAVVGFHAMGIDLAGEAATSARMQILPMLLQVHWRLPVTMGPLRPYVSAAGGIYRVVSRVETPRARPSEEVAFVPGGEGATGLEWEPGFGALITQLRVAAGRYDSGAGPDRPGVTGVNVGGLALDVGYRLAF